MLTDQELTRLLAIIENNLKPRWDRLEALELQIKELTSAAEAAVATQVGKASVTKKTRPKTSKSRSKKV